MRRHQFPDCLFFEFCAIAGHFFTPTAPSNVNEKRADIYCDRGGIAQGLSQREIARRLGISRNTVARYAASDDVPRYKRRAPRPTKLEPFHDYILQRMAAAAPEQIAAPALLRELRELGYQGQLRS